MHMEPEAGRYKFDRTINGINIEIPAQSKWYIVLFLTLWLCGWVGGEISAINTIRSRDITSNLFMIVWITGWTLGGAFAIISILWQLFGKEIISIEDGIFLHRIDIFGVGKSKTFTVSQIRILRPIEQIQNPNQKAFGSLMAWNNSFGSIGFDYGERTYYVAPGLDHAEAVSLVAKMSEKVSTKVMV